uniref:AAA domain protein n=1 Tax=Myoviridae sp. ctbEa13 TaxID=2825136 RepID=A0A8S5VBB2_9CAUD|nr:MAG TPA: AAA domain protein [Myoviridae sp. ctbEa13]
MKLGTSWIQISWTKDKRLFTNALGGWKEILPTDREFYAIKNMYRVYRKRKGSEAWKYNIAQNYANKINLNMDSPKASETVETVEEIKNPFDDKIVAPQPVAPDEESKKKELLTNTLQRMIDFFSEFDFEPNFRFVNTFARIAYCSGDVAVKSYVRNYFKLTDSPYVDSIVEKMKSSEFNQITASFKYKPSHDINTRFSLYYGSAGTGKTTAAMKEASGKCMVCHSAMLPSDLMEDFKFEDGKATFKPSALQNAIVNGETIVLDEINLLPFESLRFLQSILDGKKQFLYKGHEINIADGFKVIGTMNLTVNGTTYALPEPLVDRCEYIKEYKLNAENLLGAII